MAILEHAFELAADGAASQPASYDPERGLVLDIVSQDRSSLTVIEKPMTMVPEGEGARLLAIREEPR